MLIATDIDEVLADTLSAFIGFCNRKFNGSLKREGFFSYDWWKSMGIEFGVFLKILNEFVDNGGFDNLAPMPGAVEGINALKGGHKLIAVTSRPRAVAAITAKWLKRHFPGCFAEIFYTKELVGEKNRIPKSDICCAEGAELFIDDVYEYAAGCAAAGIKTLLYDAPWNREAMPAENMTRVSSWAEILDKVNGGSLASSIVAGKKFAETDGNYALR